MKRTINKLDGVHLAHGQKWHAAAAFRSLLIMGACAGALMGCEGEAGSGVIVSESRSIPALSKVSVCCGFDVDFKIGPQPKLVITTDDNLISDIEVDVDDGTLEIEWENEVVMYDPSQRVRLQLTLPELVRFEATGGARLRSDDISGERLHVDLSGGSDARFSQVWTDELQVQLTGGSTVFFDLVSAKKTSLDSSGGSDFEASGLSSELRASVSGGGEMRAEDLIADHVKLELSGGSEAEITALETLKGKASGASILYLSGDPKSDIDLSGGSRLKTKK